MALSALIDKADKYIVGWFLRPQLEIKDTRARAIGDMSQAVRPASYQILIKNEGRSTAKDCKPRVHFFGIRGDDPENPDSEFEVDTQVCWARADTPPTLNLHKGEEEWVEVFRLIEDYRSGGNFDPEEDRWIEFPSTEGYDTNADIMFRDDRGAEIANEKLSRPAVHQTRWMDASLEVISENANLQHTISFDDINEKLGVSIAFTDEPIDSLIDG